MLQECIFSTPKCFDIYRLANLLHIEMSTGLRISVLFELVFNWSVPVVFKKTATLQISATLWSCLRLYNVPSDLESCGVVFFYDVEEIAHPCGYNF